MSGKNRIEHVNFIIELIVQVSRYLCVIHRDPGIEQINDIYRANIGITDPNLDINKPFRLKHVHGATAVSGIEAVHKRI